MSNTALSRRKKAALARRKSDLQAALAHPPTRRLLATIFDMAGVYAPAAYGDALSMARSQGRRDVGLDLRGLIDSADPLAFVAIEAEAVTARIEAEASEKRASDVSSADETELE